MSKIRLLTLNDVRVVGRLTKDPELRFTTQGAAVCRFRLAVGRSFKDRNSGEWKEDVAFVPCNVWSETAERCGQRLKKGSPVYVEGRLKTNEWQTKEGQKRSDLELHVLKIQFLESMGDEGGTTGSSGSESADVEGEPMSVGGGSSRPMPAASPRSQASEIDNEVPF